jgi:hypothetical protein
MSGPAVSNKSPDPSVTIQFDTPVAFDVTDSTPWREIVIIAKFPTGAWECVYDGSAYGPNYSTLSTITSITGGFHFRLRRDQGWPGSPTILVHAIDTSGAEAP